MNKRISVLIPNATGPTNVGDEAILYSLLKLLKESRPNIKITVLTSDPLLCKNERYLKFDASLYEWSMARSLSFSVKLSRSIQVFTAFILLKLRMSFFIKNKGLLKIINYYANADLILYVGGGSLRTARGIKNNYILLIILMTYLFANLYKTKKIITPLSFGPFPSYWQYKLTARIVEKSDVISFREVYSGNSFKKYSSKKFFKSCDFGLFLRDENIKKTPNFTVGFTIRNWLDKEGQDILEESYAKALYQLTQKLPVKIQPIIQVNERIVKQHNDLMATKKVVAYLKKYQVKVNPQIIIKDLDQAVKTYGTINLLLGMRMHSNIIAATQGVPFVAVSYEYKTEGIARDLGMEEYCLKVEEVNPDNLLTILIKAYQNRVKLTKTIESSIKKIKQSETEKWKGIFESSI